MKISLVEWGGKYFVCLPEATFFIFFQGRLYLLTKNEHTLCHKMACKSLQKLAQLTEELGWDRIILFASPQGLYTFSWLTFSLAKQDATNASKQTLKNGKKRTKVSMVISERELSCLPARNDLFQQFWGYGFSLP